jgi:hypothetical protein
MVYWRAPQVGRMMVAWRRDSRGGVAAPIKAWIATTAPLPIGVAKLPLGGTPLWPGTSHCIVVNKSRLPQNLGIYGVFPRGFLGKLIKNKLL